MKRIEKDVIYTVFPAAPERLVTVNTAYKKCTDKVVLAGLTKEVTNAQVNNIVNALKTIGAWEIDDLDGLINLSGPNADVISTLASYFQQEFSQGAKIRIDLLWAEVTGNRPRILQLDDCWVLYWACHAFVRQWLI